MPHFLNQHNPFSAIDEGGQHQEPLPKEHHFPHVKELLETLDKEWDIPRSHLQKARALKDSLLKRQVAPVLLHGDLHQDNILSNGKDWQIIDPKGVIGSPIDAKIGKKTGHCDQEIKHLRARF